jgi:glycosyltransferase involved in cell wall biosynthesis
MFYNYRVAETGRQDISVVGHGNSVSRPLLSIIIPAFNEEERLPDTLTKLADFVRSQSFAVEAIVVDNASTDRTAGIVADFASRYPFIRYLYEARRGKGAAVRTGMLSGLGDYLLISDADLSVPITETKEFLPPVRGNYDIAIGSREIEGAVRYNEPFYRHLMGRVFNLIVRLLVLPSLHDTQCGFKCFRGDVARALFSASRIDGWSFDVEILCMARRKGYRVIEVPVDWFYGEKSKVNPARDTLVMLREIIEIRRKCRRGH